MSKHSVVSMSLKERLHICIKLNFNKCLIDHKYTVFQRHHTAV
jgi:hypothetical protein